MAWLKKNGALIAIILAAVAIAGWLFTRSSGVEGQYGNTVAYVCVETGKVFRLPKGVTRIPPVENPETKHATLLPCDVRDDGVYIADRFRAGLNLPEVAALNKTVDPKSYKVRTAP